MAESWQSSATLHLRAETAISAALPSSSKTHGAPVSSLLGSGTKPASPAANSSSSSPSVHLLEKLDEEIFDPYDAVSFITSAHRALRTLDNNVTRSLPLESAKNSAASDSTSSTNEIRTLMSRTLMPLSPSAFTSFRNSVKTTPVFPMFPITGSSSSDKSFLALYDPGTFKQHAPEGAAFMTTEAAKAWGLKVKPRNLTVLGAGSASVTGEIAQFSFRCFTQVDKAQHPVMHTCVLDRVFVVDNFGAGGVHFVFNALSIKGNPDLSQVFRDMQAIEAAALDSPFLVEEPIISVRASKEAEPSARKTSIGNFLPLSDQLLSRQYVEAASNHKAALISLLANVLFRDDLESIELLLPNDGEDIAHLRDRDKQAASLEAVLSDPTLTPEAKEAIKSNPLLFRSLLDSAGYIGPQVKVELHDGVRPWGVVRQPIPVKKTHQDFLVSEVISLLKDGIIRRAPDVPGYLDYTSSCLIVQSGAQNKLRLVQALLKLNKASKVFPSPLPTQAELFRATAGKRWFSHLDLTKAFFQLVLEEGSRKFFSFRLPDMDSFKGGRFEYCRMPLGWVNATFIFQRTMTAILGDLIAKGVVLVYLDDVLVLTETREEHKQVLSEVLRRLGEKGFIANASKCSFMQPSAEFLGMHIDGHTIKVLERHREAIKNLPTPGSLKDLQVAMGLFNYFRWLIPGFAKVASCLYDLTAPNTPVAKKWKEEHQTAFDTLKQLLYNNSTVHTLSGTGKIIVRTDASDVGYGGVVLQEQEGKLVPISWQSVKARRKAKSVGEQEMLAFAYTLSKCKDLLGGRNFTWQCDHRNLCTTDHKSPILQRIALETQGYDFTFEHIPGPTNVVADPLSRMPSLPWPTYAPMGLYMLLSALSSTESTHSKTEALAAVPHLVQLCSHSPTASLLIRSPRDSSTAPRPHFTTLVGELRRSDRSSTKASSATAGVTAEVEAERAFSTDMAEFNSAKRVIKKKVQFTPPPSSNSSSSSMPSSSAATSTEAFLSTSSKPLDTARAASSPYLPLLAEINEGLYHKASPLVVAIVEAQRTFDVKPKEGDGGKWSEESFLSRTGVVLSIHKRNGVIVIPSEATQLHLAIFTSLHDNHSHAGISTLRDSLSRLVTWPTLEADLTSFVKSCYVCQHTLAKRTHVSVAPGHFRPPPSLPRQRYVMDFLGPLPTPQADSPSYALITVDALTRYTHGFMVTPATGGSPTSSEVISCLRKLFREQGVPQEIQSDGASIFSSKEIMDFYTSLGIDSHITTPRRPQANGIAEKFMDLLQIALRSHVGTSTEDWADHFDQCISDLNDRHHSAIGMSPFKAQFGFNKRSPTEALLDTTVLTPQLLTQEDIVASLQAYHHMVTEATKIAFARSLKDQESRAARVSKYLRHHRTFEAGTFVLLENNLVPSKLSSHFSPIPYQILHAEPNDIYRINSILTPNVSLRAHAQHLLPLDTTRTSAAGHLQYALDNGVHVVDAILGHKEHSDGSFLFQVKWDIPGDSDTTWETQETLAKLSAFKDYVRLHKVKVPKHRAISSEAAAASFLLHFSTT